MIRKLIVIVVSGFLFLVALGGFLLFVESKDFVDLMIGIVFALIGVFSASRFKKKKPVNSAPTSPEYNDSAVKKRLNEITPTDDKTKPTLAKNDKRYFTFRVAGVTMKNENDDNVQTLLKEYVNENLDEKYQGLSNKEILEEYSPDDKIYESSDIYGNDVEFIYEPTNPYDPDAIKIVIKRIGHVGYVPRTDTQKIKDILENSKHNETWEVLGGKFKYIDEDEEKVKIASDNYGIAIEMSYS